jgi:hypothetical protein
MEIVGQPGEITPVQQEVLLRLLHLQEGRDRSRGDLGRTTQPCVAAMNASWRRRQEPTSFGIIISIYDLCRRTISMDQAALRGATSAVMGAFEMTRHRRRRTGGLR